MQRKLYFERSNGNLISLGVVDGEDEENRSKVFSVVKQFCADHHYKIPYTRMWNAPMNGTEMTCLDVGSHTEFFWVEPPLELTT